MISLHLNQIQLQLYFSHITLITITISHHSQLPLQLLPFSFVVVSGGLRSTPVPLLVAMPVVVDVTSGRFYPLILGASKLRLLCLQICGSDWFR
jgi:hypothetical protein